jgi:hypothetical protein
MNPFQYNIAKNRLEVVSFSEFISMDSQMKNEGATLGTNIKRQLIEEPLVNHMKLTADGDLHVNQLFEYPDIGWYPAIIVGNKFDRQGNNVTLDSYWSDDPLYSTDEYYDPAKGYDLAYIITSSSFDDAIGTTLPGGNVDCMGYVCTNGTASVDIGPSGSVGTKEWVEPGFKGIEPGHHLFDVIGTPGGIRNDVFNSIICPFAFGATPESGTIDDVFYDYVLDQPIDYRLANLSGKVYVSADCRLLVTNNINIIGSGILRIAVGGQLKLYMNGHTANFGGQGIHNMSGIPSNFKYYGCELNTSVRIGGKGASYPHRDGTAMGITAPNAIVRLNTGVEAAFDYMGWILANSIELLGRVDIHVDWRTKVSDPDREPWS